MNYFDYVPDMPDWLNEMPPVPDDYDYGPAPDFDPADCGIPVGAATPTRSPTLTACYQEEDAAASPPNDDEWGTVTNEYDATDLLKALWREGHSAYYWQLSESLTYVDRDGKTQKQKRSTWFDLAFGVPPMPKDIKGQSTHVYFGIAPTVRRGEIWQRASEKGKKFPRVASIACFFGDFDAKDFDPLLKAASEEYKELVKAGRASEWGGADPTEGKRLALAHINSLPITPSEIIDSGGGYQAYWLLEVPTCDFVEWKRLSREFVVAVGADGNAKDLQRVFRLPGSWNVKGLYGEPIRVKIVHQDLTIRYTMDEIREFAVKQKPLVEVSENQPSAKRTRKASQKPVASAPSPDFTPSGKLIGAAFLDDLREQDGAPADHLARRMIDALGNLDYARMMNREDRLVIGMAIHHATDGSEWGLALFRRLGTISPKHDDAKLGAAWAGFDQRREGGVTFGSVFHMARIDSPDWGSLDDYREPVGVIEAAVKSGGDLPDIAGKVAGMLSQFFEGVELPQNVIDEATAFIAEMKQREAGFAKVIEMDLVDDKYMPSYDAILSASSAKNQALESQCGSGKNHQYLKHRGDRIIAEPLISIGAQMLLTDGVPHVNGDTDLEKTALWDQAGYIRASSTYESSEKLARYAHAQMKQDGLLVILDESHMPASMPHRPRAGRALESLMRFQEVTNGRTIAQTGTPLDLRFSLLPADSTLIKVKPVKRGVLRVAVVDKEPNIGDIIDSVHATCGDDIRIFVRLDNKRTIDAIMQTERFRECSIAIHGNRRGTHEYQRFMAGELADHIRYIFCTSVASTGANLPPSFGRYAFVFAQGAIISSEDVDQAVSRVRDGQHFVIPDLVVIQGKTDGYGLDSINKMVDRQFRVETIKAYTGLLMAEMSRALALGDRYGEGDALADAHDWGKWHVYKTADGHYAPYKISRSSVIQAVREIQRRVMTPSDIIEELAVKSLSFDVVRVALKAAEPLEVPDAKGLTEELNAIKRIEREDKNAAFSDSLAIIKRDKERAIKAGFEPDAPEPLREAATRVRQIQKLAVGNEEFDLPSTLAVIEELGAETANAIKRVKRIVKNSLIFEGSLKRSGNWLADAEREWAKAYFVEGGIYGMAEFTEAYNILTADGTTVSHLADSPKALRKLVRSSFKWEVSTERTRKEKQEKKTKVISHKLFEAVLKTQKVK